MIAWSTRAWIAAPIEAGLVVVIILLAYFGPYWRWRNPEAADRHDIESERRREQSRRRRVERERERNEKRGR